MRLTRQQILEYRASGLLVLESVFASEEVEALRAALRRDRDLPGEHRVMEDDGRRIRAIYASHHRQPEFAALVRHRCLAGPVRQLLDVPFYVYQFKINTKSPYGGESWSWHQDFAAWAILDGLTEPRLINVGVFLDDVTDSNGPVVFVPGSHRSGLLREVGRTGEVRSAQHLDPHEIALNPPQMDALTAELGTRSATGPAGTVVFFSPEIVHGSAQNTSPRTRDFLIVTYNAVQNAPPPTSSPRPDYLVGRDVSPIPAIDA